MLKASALKSTKVKCRKLQVVVISGDYDVVDSYVLSSGWLLFRRTFRHWHERTGKM